MKTLSKSILIVLCITLLCSAQLFGQEWSEEQKEVWKNVETYWDLDAKRNLEGVMDYFHDDYSGWFNQSALPGDKASTRKFFAHFFETTKILVQDINPVAINIHDNISIVHYYYSRVVTDVEGKERYRSGRWTDILMKQGDKWVLIGDHGGPSATN
jgi:ketosteroid isomerase-like protein